MAFRIIRNDITKVSADVIVNSANPRPICGGSTEAHIYDVAGYDDLLEARQEVGYLEVGQLGVTPAFNLSAKNIIHISCPWWNEEKPKESEEVLVSCYAAVIERARLLGAKSIAFPLLSSGVYRFPKKVALEIATSVFGAYEKEEIEIVLVVYDPEAFALAGEFVPEVQDFLKDDLMQVSESSLPVTSLWRKPRFADAEIRERETSSDDVCYACYSPQKPEDLAEERPGDRRFYEIPSYLIDEFIDAKARRKKSRDVADDSRALKSAKPAPEKPALESSVPKALEGFATFKKPAQKRSAALKLEDEIGEMIMSMDDDSFQDKMMGYIEQKGMDPSTVYRAANLDRKLFSKVKKEGYVPSKNTALALAVGLQLNFEETSDLLSRAGHAFSPASKRDEIIKLLILKGDLYKKGIYRPIDVINDYLTTYQEAPLGME